MNNRKTNIPEDILTVLDANIKADKNFALSLCIALYKPHGKKQIVDELVNTLPDMCVDLNDLLGDSFITDYIRENKLEVFNYSFKKIVISSKLVFRDTLNSRVSVFRFVLSLLNLSEKSKILNFSRVEGLCLEHCLNFMGGSVLDKMYFDFNDIANLTILPSALPNFNADAIILGFNEDFKYTENGTDVSYAGFLKTILESPHLNIVNKEGYVVCLVPLDFAMLQEYTSFVDYIFHCRKCKYIIKLPSNFLFLLVVFSKGENTILTKIDCNTFSTDTSEGFDYINALYACRNRDHRVWSKDQESLAELILNSLLSHPLFKSVPDAVEGLEFLKKNHVISDYLVGRNNKYLEDKEFLNFIENLFGQLQINPHDLVFKSLLSTADFYPLLNLSITTKYTYSIMDTFHACILSQISTDKSSTIDRCEGKIITLMDLSESFYDCKIDFNRVTHSKGKGYELTSPCILIACVNGVTRVGVVEDLSETDVYVAPYIQAIELKNESNVDLEYLLYYLTNAQITRLKSNKYEAFFYCPSLEIQKQLIKDFMTAKLKEKDSAISREYQLFKKSISHRKHRIGQLMPNLEASITTLYNKIRKTKEPITKETLIGHYNPKTIVEYLEREQHLAAHISKLIETMTASDLIIPENISISTIIQKYINNNTSDRYTLIYNDNITKPVEMMLNNYDVQIPDNVKKDEVFFPPEGLSEIIENIVYNACSHGFTDCSSKENIIKIESFITNLSYVLEISNNGKPVEEGMTPERIFEYGESSKQGEDGHQGTGCSVVYELMKQFGGNAEVKLNPQAEFPITFVLTFNNTVLTKYM